MLLALPTVSTGQSNGTTEIASVDSAGHQAEGHSEDSDISGNGRYVAFSSFASNLVPGDTNEERDVFVHDTKTGATERVSVDSNGNQALHGNSWGPSISADGRYVAFYSVASNLSAAQSGIYVHDRETGTTELVSVNNQGQVADDGVGDDPAISSDGRYVAFESTASNLVPNETPNCSVGPFKFQCVDIFVRDQLRHSTERVSVSSGGEAANLSSFHPSISGNGRYVAFESGATNLVLGNTSLHRDVFVHDRRTGVTERVSLSGSGDQGNGGSESPSISANGRYVAFASNASNLVSNDDNNSCPPTPDIGGPSPSIFNCPDVFVRDLVRGTTERVSVDDGGHQANGASGSPSISDNGRFVAFASNASNLVSGDGNGVSDIFVHDRSAGTTIRSSVSSFGVEANRDSSDPRISADGQFVSFWSRATNLVPGDTALCGIENCIDVFVRASRH